MNQPDHLRNVLIRMRNGEGLRRVIRDDGANGLWIANPNTPAQMRQISREEYEANWEVERSGDQQNTEVLSGTKWGRMGQPTENVVMNGMQNVNTFTAEVTPMEARKNEGFDGGRSEETDREAMKREILGSPVLDADFSGDPVAANEESVSTFEPDRAMSEADAEAAEAREEELSGQFQEFEPADAQLGDDGADMENEGAPAPEDDEPTAGNEDPDEAAKADREAAKAQRKAEKDAAKAAAKAEREAAK